MLTIRVTQTEETAVSTSNEHKEQNTVAENGVAPCTDQTAGQTSTGTPCVEPVIVAEAALPRQAEQGNVAKPAAEKGENPHQGTKCNEEGCGGWYKNIRSHRSVKHGGGSGTKKCNATGCEYETNSNQHLNRHKKGVNCPFKSKKAMPFV
jgi:hypothetical protein